MWDFTAYIIGFDSEESRNWGEVERTRMIGKCDVVFQLTEPLVVGEIYDLHGIGTCECVKTEHGGKVLHMTKVKV